MKKHSSKVKSGKFSIIFGTIFVIVCVVFVCVLIARFSSSNDKQVDQYVSLDLKGSETMYLYVGEAYREPGYIALGNVTGDINKYVNVSGEVNTKSAGTYRLSYKLAYNGAILEKVRTVNVSKKPVSNTVTKEDQVGVQDASTGKIDDNSNSSSSGDDNSGTTTNPMPPTSTQKPQQVVDRITLKLMGYTEVYLLQGSKYIDAGAQAITSSGVNATDKIVTTGSVDTNKPGTYTISYTVTDSLGDSVTLTRKVYVLKMDVSSTITTLSKTNKSLILKVSVAADKFSYVLLPDGKKTDSANFEYTITKNGKYSFKVYNVYGLMRNYTYTIGNIDKVPPSGSCSGYTKGGKSYINVKASDNSGILKYRVNGKDYTSNDIILDKMIDKPTITIYDSVGNTKSISCTLESKSIVYNKEFSLKKFSSSYGSSFQYWLNVPEGTTEQMPILLYLHGDGEVGRINALKNVYQIQYIVNEYKGDPFVLVAPLTNIKSWVSGSIPASLIDLVNNVAKTYNSDYSRIYIIGFSRGAIGVWNLVNMYPDYFAAAMPVSCCPHGNHNPSNFTKTKVKAIVGTVGYEKTYSACMSPFVQRIKNAGGDAELITYNGATHTTITRAIDYEWLYKWMLQQKK